MKLIDTHCHIDTELFAENIDTFLQNSTEKGVTDFVVPGYIAKGWDNLLALSSRYTNIHPAPGLHPLYLSYHKKEDLFKLDQLCRQKLPVAIGEIGLDFYYPDTDRDKQTDLFKQQLYLAAKFQLPVLLHIRKAHDQVQSILRKMHFKNGGIVHAFNGSRQQADKYTELGFKLGYGGNITYDKATRIRKLAAELPLSAIVLETDAPDMPLAHRKEAPNSPEYLPEILETLIKLRTESKEKIVQQININVQEALPGIFEQCTN